MNIHFDTSEIVPAWLALAVLVAYFAVTLYLMYKVSQKNYPEQVKLLWILIVWTIPLIGMAMLYFRMQSDRPTVYDQSAGS